MEKVIVRDAWYPVAGGLIDEILDELAPSLDGLRVLIKPNCLMGSDPEKGVTTHPSLVRELRKSLLRRGAKVWVGDNPGARGYGAVEKCFQKSGLLDAAGESFIDFGRDGVSTRIDSPFMDRVIVSRPLLEADFVITAPKLKTHCLTLMTGAVKNMYGILVGGEKTKIHCQAKTGERFSEAVVDVFRIRPPDLTVMDAVEIMEGDGPSHGTLQRAGTIIASRNAVAADSVASMVMGIKPGRVCHLEKAASRGLGPAGKEAIDISGTVSPVKGFRLPSTFRLGLMSAISNRLVFNILQRSRLQIDRERCEACGECEAVCPSEAVTAVGGAYRIDPARCHQCFCCYEVCPPGAIDVRGALAALLRKNN